MEGLRPKQQAFMEAFRSGNFRYLMAAGSTGSGKSIVTIGALHIMCCIFPGLRFAVIRKSEKNLKQTTIPSYSKIKTWSKSFNESRVVDMSAKYKNGSEILFIWADITKDPDLDNIKGLELTGALIEEANQIDQRYFELLKTRIGRWNNKHCPQFIMLNMNPTAGWCKEMFYDNWVSGTLPEKYYFSEFDVTDIEDLIKNTDEISDEFLSGLNDLPDEEKGRFLHNHWDYSDIPNQLVRYEWYKNACLDRYFIKKTDRGLLAIDPADQGKDSTVIGRMHGNHIGWWEEYAKQDPGKTGFIGLERARENNIVSKDVSIDGIGVGTGTITAMRMEKFYPHIFISGETPTRNEGFLKTANKRAEAHWMFRESLRNEEITLEHNVKLQNECTKCQYDVTDKVIKILPKETLKKPKYIGWSPGHLDVATMLTHKYVTTSDNLSEKIFDRQTSNIMQRNTLSRADRERSNFKRRSIIGVYT